jgi:isopentenyl phosphate kinase
VNDELVFVKLGGSLITDKGREATPRPALIRRLAEEMRAALDAHPQLRIVLGHGSGSFGHWEADKHGTAQGVATPDQWRGFANVSAAAARLNRLVTDAFWAADVPIISLQPSAAASADAGEIIDWHTTPLREALDHGLIPLIFGDVAFDQTWGGTILSTERLFFYLAERLAPARILLFGNAPGVLDDQHRVIPEITPATYPQIAPFLAGAESTDVTGGMADKVQRMIALVERVPHLRVWILTGRAPGHLKRALESPEATPGTLIHQG